jgi:hypothetical protein
LLPWVQYLLEHGLNGGGKRHFAPEFYLQWLTTGWGLNLEHQMASVFWREFLAAPQIGGMPTYGMAIAHLLLVVAGLGTLVAWVTSKVYRQQVRSVPGFGPLRFYLIAGAIGMGGLLTDWAAGAGLLFDDAVSVSLLVGGADMQGQSPVVRRDRGVATGDFGDVFGVYSSAGRHCRWPLWPHLSASALSGGTQALGR